MPPLVDATRATKLVSIARERFDDMLSEAEVRVLEDSAASEDPKEPGPWEAKLPLRATFLRWLATDTVASPFIDQRGIRVRSAQLEGVLDLNGCQVAHPLVLFSCDFIDGLNLTSAELSALYFNRCVLQVGMEASRLKLGGPLYIRNLRSAGTINLSGAEIGAEVRLLETILEGEHADLVLYDTRIKKDLDLSYIRVTGMINLSSIHVDGQVLCRYGQLGRWGENPVGNAGSPAALALVLDTGTIAGRVDLLGLRWSGIIQAKNAQIGNDLLLSGAEQHGNELALDLGGSTIKGALSLKDARFWGGVFMVGGSIGGNLDCTEVWFKLQKSLNARAGDTAHALEFVSVQIQGEVYLDDLVSERTVALRRCQCGRSVFLRGGSFFDSSVAVELNGTTVQKNVLFTERFQAHGEVRLANTYINGDVNCFGAYMARFEANGMRLEGDLWWVGIVAPERAELFLDNASIRTLHDERASWPDPGSLSVLEFVYKKLQLHEPRTKTDQDDWTPGKEISLEVGARTEWLNRQRADDQIDPQPWLQLAAVLRANGDEAGAKWAVFRLKEHQAAGRWWGVRYLRKAWNSLRRNPWLILRLLVVSFSIGWATFHLGRGSMAPTNKEAYANHLSKQSFGFAYPEFNSFFYTLENDLPLVKLGQDDKWAPDPSLPSRIFYWWLMGTRWFLILIGWFQGTVLLAAVGSQFRN